MSTSLPTPSLLTIFKRPGPKFCVVGEIQATHDSYEFSLEAYAFQVCSVKSTKIYFENLQQMLISISRLNTLKQALDVTLGYIHNGLLTLNYFGCLCILALSSSYFLLCSLFYWEINFIISRNEKEVRKSLTTHPPPAFPCINERQKRSRTIKMV